VIAVTLNSNDDVLGENARNKEEWAVRANETSKKNSEKYKVGV
jgi:hypothetical protein